MRCWPSEGVALSLRCAVLCCALLRRGRACCCPALLPAAVLLIPARGCGPPSWVTEEAPMLWPTPKGVVGGRCCWWSTLSANAEGPAGHWLLGGIAALHAQEGGSGGRETPSLRAGSAGRHGGCDAVVERQPKLRACAAGMTICWPRCWGRKRRARRGLARRTCGSLGEAFWGGGLLQECLEKMPVSYDVYPMRKGSMHVFDGVQE